MIIMFLVLLVINTIAALGIKSLINESDFEWLKTKLVRTILLVPPVAFVSGVVIWFGAILHTIYEGLSEYFND